MGIFLLLCAIPLGTIAFAARRRRLLVPIGAVIAAGTVGIAFAQTGVLQQSSLASTDVSPLLATQSFSSRCEESFDALIEAKVVLARPTADGLVVNGELWGQLPANIQEAIRACAANIVDPESGPDGLQVITR